MSLSISPRFMLRGIVAAGLLLVATHGSWADAAFTVPAGERQLFLDDVGIASTKNLTRTMHQPAKKGAVIRPDPAKGGSFQIRSAPLWDPKEELLKLLVADTSGPTSAYRWYISVDGLHWTAGQKPNWGELSVVYDAQDPAPARRCKAVETDTWHGVSWHTKCTGGFYVSPDGIDWTKIKSPGFPSYDEHNLSLDERDHMFLLTTKCRGPYGRSHGLGTSKDFENWTNHGLIFHADKLDQEMNRKAITAQMAELVADPRLAETDFYEEGNYNVDIYNTGVFRYESHYLAMPAIHPSRAMVLSDPSDNIAFKMVQLMCSRDLRTWTRLGGRGNFIGLSPLGGGAYDIAQVLPPSNAVVRGDELWFYYTGARGLGWPPKKQFQPPMRKWIYSRPDNGAICLAVLRRDGFISLDAGDAEGKIETKPFRLAGSKLFVNVDAFKGELGVKVLDKDGEVLAVSEPMKGDLLRGEVKWRQGDIAGLKGKAVSLRFTVRNASLYSYWLQ